MPKKKTSGAFDPQQGPLYFLAGNGPSVLAAGEMHPAILIALDGLMSEDAERILVQLLDSGVQVMIDSGVFSLCSTHSKLTGMPLPEVFALHPEQVQGYDKLWKRYAYILETYGDRVWGAVEIDLGGARVSTETRERIESELGWVPIPVYHPVTDHYDYFDELLATYDRVCVGGSVSTKGPVRRRFIRDCAERARAHPDVWLHYLGVHVSELFLSLPPQGGSSDSTKWLTPVRWAPAHSAFGMLRIFAPFQKEIVYDRDLKESVRAATLGAVQSHYASHVWESWTRELIEHGLREPLCPE